MMKSTIPSCLFLCMAAAFAQPAAPAFETASVKPSKSEVDSSSWHSRPGYLVMHNQTLRALVRIAYEVRDDQVSGGPKWIESDRFDVEARASGPVRDAELMAMLKTLLAERFQLGVHRDTKLISGYAMVVAKDGLKIQPDETEGKSKWQGHRGSIAAEKVTMAKVAESVGRVLGSRVVDQTNVPGTFTFTLEFDPDSGRTAPAADASPEAPLRLSLFTVLQRQLGLKLESHKEPLELIVVDKAERPPAN